MKSDQIPTQMQWSETSDVDGRGEDPVDEGRVTLGNVQLCLSSPSSLPLQESNPLVLLAQSSCRLCE